MTAQMSDRLDRKSDCGKGPDWREESMDRGHDW
jgi:hypothetical protein